MGSEDVERFVTGELAKLLKDQGFLRKGDYLLCRESGEALHCIICGARTDAQSDQTLVSLSVGLKLKRVELLLNPDPEGTVDSMTLTVPIHLLHSPPRHYSEWPFDDPCLVETLFDEIKMYALPFFERYTKSENLMTPLANSDPGRWFALSPESRTKLRAALLALHGRKGDALEIIDNAILTEKKTPVRLRLKRVRERIDAAS
jgi:hypothetical protein